MNKDELLRIRAAMESAARTAAELILQAHGILAEAKTGRRDVVTEYDRRVQQTLISLLLEAVPNAHFFCEEMDEQDRLDEEQIFIIDPIDGTMNFVRGFHHSCISIGYMERGEILIGIVYNPYVGELFSAVAGCGATLNGMPIHVAEAGLADSIVCFGTSPYRPDLADQTFTMARKAFDAALDLRREGAAALDLCSVAAGRAGLYFELQLSFWDYAAGQLIIKEAGGICCRPDRSELLNDGSKCGVVAGSPAAIDDFFHLM